jgi:hypothetical protein
VYKFIRQPPLPSDWEDTGAVHKTPILSDWPEPYNPIEPIYEMPVVPPVLMPVENKLSSGPSFGDVLDVPEDFTLTMGPDGEIVCADPLQKALDNFVEETSEKAHVHAREARTENMHVATAVAQDTDTITATQNIMHAA